MKKILSLLAIIVFVVATAACSSAPEMQNAMTPNAEANKENTATQNEAEAPQEDASNPNEEVAGSDEKLKELNKEAEQAYQEFLEGKRTFARGEAFKVDYEDEVAIDHLKYREYDYQQFIDALEQYQSPLTVLYAFDDIDQDGINEMIINLEAQTNEAENDGFSNWIGFIRYEDKNLSMFSSFIHHNSDGPEWNLYTSGIAEFFNSYEDSLFFRDVYEIDQDGFLQQLFSETTSYNGYVSHLYQVVSGSYNEAMQGEGDYLATHSNLTAREYRKGSEVKITVDNWSKDPQLRAREKKYIDKVVEQNVELISNEQMDELTTLDEDKHKPIAWKTWEKTSPKNINTTNNNNTTNQPALSIDYFDAQRDGLTNSNSYHEYTVDISDYQIAALLRTAVPIKHLSVFYFEVEDVSNDGVPVGQVFGGYYLEELTPDKPLVLHTTIQGTFPTVAVGYYDKDEYVTYGIIMNGMDGSLELTPVIIK